MSKLHPPRPPHRPESSSDNGYVMTPPFDDGVRRPGITMLRHTVSADALLSAEEVVQLLGGRQAAVRRWLRQVPSMWHPTARRMYRWGDILVHLRREMKEVA